jgi:tryptophan 2,3-dioxygenase
MTTPALTYSAYLRLDELLSLQTPRSETNEHRAEHDELLFIVIHQVYELWFKQTLHEIDFLCERLTTNDTPRALHTLQRMLTILKTVVSQIDVLETMTPLEFNAFRGYLDAASGFQSSQFRELEFVLGHKRATILRNFPEDSSGHARLKTRLEQPTVWDAFLRYLALKGYAVPGELLQRDVREPTQPSREVQAILLDVYRNNPAVAQICERLIDYDEGLQEWRYRHVKMVERTIGNKRGTGGSSGVEYLSATLQPVFPDLWQIRTQL